MFEFKDILAGVLSTLGIKSFAKDDKGNSILSADQKTKLTEKWGDKFVAEFAQQLSASQEEKGAIAETELQVAMAGLQAKNKANAEELKELKDKLAAADLKEKKLQASITEKDGQITKLSKEPGSDDGKEVTGENKKNMGKTQFKPDMSIEMNQFYNDKYYGKASGEYSGNTTIDTQKLQTEFGKYVNSEKLEVIQRMLIKTTSTALMSTIMTEKTEVRAITGEIKSVLQQFIPHWTPKSKATFTPLTIKNFKCKINQSIIPSDIMEQILGYLYDENLKPEDMPIVKYILFQLVFPKLDEDRETALATGYYKENKVDENGKYSASDATSALDGYLTILSREKLNADTAVNFFDPKATITQDNILDVFDAYADSIKPVYQGSGLPVSIDPNLLLMYQRAYRKKYPNTKNEDGAKTSIDFTKFNFEPVEGMRGTGCFFATPKENWKHLMSQDPQSAKVWMATVDYEARIYAEYWEATGFWLADAIFAYISDSQLTAYKTAAGIAAAAKSAATGD